MSLEVRISFAYAQPSLTRLFCTRLCWNLAMRQVGLRSLRARGRHTPSSLRCATLSVHSHTFDDALVRLHSITSQLHSISRGLGWVIYRFVCGHRHRTVPCTGVRRVVPAHAGGYRVPLGLSEGLSLPFTHICIPPCCYPCATVCLFALIAHPVLVTLAAICTAQTGDPSSTSSRGGASTFFEGLRLGLGVLP